jgi:hypothetical protein
MMPQYKYNLLLQGAKQFDHYSSWEDRESVPRRIPNNGKYANMGFYDMVHEYGMYDVPAFKDEVFITTKEDYILKVNFHLAGIILADGSRSNFLSTWPKIIQSLLDSEQFGGFIKKSQKLASKEIDVKSLSRMPEKDRFDIVMDYVKSNYKWNGRHGMTVSKGHMDFINHKYGNSGEINLFTIALLKSVGLKAEPIILSTRNNGKIKTEYPFINFFNYSAIMVLLDDEMILADATDTNLAHDRLPTKCINDKALQVVKKGINWVDLECGFPSTISTYIHADINQNMMEADVLIKADEYFAYNFRNTLHNNTENIKNYFEKAGYSIEEESINVRNHEVPGQAYQLRAKVLDAIDTIDQKLFISPFLKEMLVENPFKENERKYPVELIHPIKKII